MECFGLKNLISSAENYLLNYISSKNNLTILNKEEIDKLKKDSELLQKKEVLEENNYDKFISYTETILNINVDESSFRSNLCSIVKLFKSIEKDDNIIRFAYLYYDNDKCSKVLVIKSLINNFIKIVEEVSERDSIVKKLNFKIINICIKDDTISNDDEFKQEIIKTYGIKNVDCFY